MSKKAFKKFTQLNKVIAIARNAKKKSTDGKQEPKTYDIYRAK